jgi:hypothetical protein
MTELEQILVVRDSRLQLEVYFAGLIRAGSFDALDAELADQIAANPSRFDAVSRAAGPASIHGWDELYADIAALDAKGEQVTAIGIDLTGHGEGDEPEFEVSFYDDSSFAFSGATHADLLAASEGYSTEWQGCFLDIGNMLEVRGLAPLHRALREYPHRWNTPGAELPEDYAGFVLAQWMLYLRVHQALAAALAEQGLPRPMPVVVGEHDFGPTCHATYMVDRIADNAAATARILEERDAASAQAYDRNTERMIAETRERRAVVRYWFWWRNRKERKTSIELAEAQEKLLFDGVVSTRGQQPVWRLSDREFETFLDRFREHRRPGSSGEAHPDPGADRSELHRTFLRHGIRFGGGAAVERDIAKALHPAR